MSFTDSFLDFEAIKNWFDNIPNPDMADGEKIDAGIRKADSCLESLVAGAEERECKMSENGTCSIEEDLGKVSLVGRDSVSADSCLDLLPQDPFGEVSKLFVANGEERECETFENKNITTESEVADVVIFEAESCVDVLAQEPIGEVSELSVANGEEKECGTLEKATGLIKEDSVVGENGNSVSVNENTTTESGEADENGAEERESSESESATTLTASSSSSSSDSSSDDDSDDSDTDVTAEKKDDPKTVKAKVKANEAAEVEEGEIRDAINDEADAMVGWSDDDDLEEGGVVKPIRSKNEVTDLPHVPPVDVSLLPHHQTTPVGVVQSILGTRVIVEGIEKHSPLSDGSILWITETRSPLGFVDEIFGPVKNPYYIVRFNSEAEIPSGISTNTAVSFVPEFASHVLKRLDIYKKGYDASGANDEELSDEDEFSDDEKEAEHKKMLKMAKRGSTEQRPGDGKQRNNKNNNQAVPSNFWRNSQNRPPSPSLPATGDHGNFSPSYYGGHRFTAGSGVPMFSPVGYFARNGMSCYQPPGLFVPANNMPWPMQHPPQYVYQMPMPNRIPFNPNQGQPFAGFPYPQGQGGPSNFNPVPFGFNVQGEQQGVNPAGAVMGQSFNGPQHGEGNDGSFQSGPFQVMGQSFNGPQHGGGNDSSSPQRFQSGPFQITGQSFNGPQHGGNDGSSLQRSPSGPFQVTGQSFNGPQNGGGNDGSAPQHFPSGSFQGGMGSNHRGGDRFGHRARGRGRRQ